MAFWNNPSSLAPKQSHRWVISLGDSKIPAFLAKSVDRPSYDIGKIEAKHLYGNTVNFPKRVTWKPIKIQFYDALIANNTLNGDDTYKSATAKAPKHTINGYNNVEYLLTTSGYFYHLLKNAGYYNPGANDSYQVYTFKNNLINILLGGQRNLSGDNNRSQDYITIVELSEFGEQIEKWKIHKPLITNVEYGKYDYSSDEIMLITVDIAYDWAEAELVIASKGISTNIKNNLKTSSVAEIKGDTNAANPQNTAVYNQKEDLIGYDKKAIDAIKQTGTKLENKLKDVERALESEKFYPEKATEKESGVKHIAVTKKLDENGTSFDEIQKNSIQRSLPFRDFKG